MPNRHVATTFSDGSTLCEVFQATVADVGDSVALQVHGSDTQLTWNEYAAQVERVAGGLAAIGVKRGDTVALMLSNRPEAMVVDTAVMHLGAIPFSVYNTSSPEQLEYLFGHGKAGVVVTESQFAEPVLGVAPRLPLLREIVMIDGSVPGASTLADLERAGDTGFDLATACRNVTADDIATVIYTSGTTGPPKGVELTHSNVVNQWRLVNEVHPIRRGGRLVSYLPMAHLADRAAAHYAGILTGASVTCVADPRNVVAALADIHPTMWMAVPRIWEKLRAALEPMVAAATEPAARSELAAQLRDQLGLDQVDLLLSGAAPIAQEVLTFFADLGLGIYEVWGMTETCAAATLSPPGQHRVGTVGKAIPGVEVTLAGDGELLVRGPTVMRGYRGDPERTAEAIDAEGWMHTGDIGRIDADGYISIVDRKKELIISSAGKNMSPSNIENALKAACPLIGSVVAIGDRRAYNTALIVLDPDAAATLAATIDVADTPTESLAEHPAIQAVIAAGVETANAKLSRVEQVKRYTLLTASWEPGGDELTPTMKLRRTPIAEKYAAQIDAMYD